jgi:glycosyltransferase involved in cell wall biosynthesis
MIKNTICLDENYSTTRLVTQEKPEIINKPEDKFESVLFLPEGENRKGEGGLRRKGYFKKSYEDKPLITIITVVFNGEKYLEQTIQSVINQTYDNVEYIIIDGGSTDGTLDIIKKYEDYIDYWVSEKDGGMYNAINKAIKASIGDVIGLVNSDDFLNNKNIIKIISEFFNNSSYEGIYGNEIDVDKDGNILKKVYTYNVTYKELLFSQHSTFVPHPTLYLKRNAFHKIGLYDENYKYASDYLFILKCLEYLKINHINYFLISFRVHNESITGTGRLENERKNILKEFKLYSYNFIFRQIMYYFVWIKFKIYNMNKNKGSKYDN